MPGRRSPEAFARRQAKAASKAELWSELRKQEHKLARQRSELAARERAAPKINDELFVLAAESLRGVQDAIGGANSPFL